MYKKLIIYLITITSLGLLCNPIKGQTAITLEKALEIAGQNSPDIQLSTLTLSNSRSH